MAPDTSTATDADAQAALADIERLGGQLRAARTAIGRVIYGQQDVIDQTLVTLLSGGHLLLIGVPGLAKTLLVETLGKVRLVDFRYTDDYRAKHPVIEDRRYLNVIAQEFAEVFPDAVKPSGETLPNGSPILQVDTYPLTIYSAAAVQELHRENEALKKKLAGQEERLRRLEEALAK